MNHEVHLHVRAGTHDDIARCGTIWYTAQVARNPARADEYGAQIAQSVIGKRVETPDSIFVVGEANGELAALAIGVPARDHDGAGAIVPGVMHINSLAVEPRFWGHGIGEEILERLLDQGRKKGYISAQLWMHEGNKRAERLYKHFGFVPMNRITLDGHHEHIHQYVAQL